MADDTLNADVGATAETGRESSLSNWAGDYVTGMLGEAEALSDVGYQAYTGPLTAGESDLQTKAFDGVANLTMPTNMGVSGYQPLSFGGSRQAVLDAENQRSLQSNLAGITGAGYRDAYDKATNQFNLEQDRGMTAQDKTNEYGLTTLGAYTDLGQIQRDIESEGITADRMQFEEERDYPYKDIQFKQSLLSGLPITAMDYNYKEPSYLQTLAADAGDFESFFKGLLGDGFSKTTDTKTETS